MSMIEPSMGLNAFNKAKYKNETETIAKAFLNLLFGKPGYFPSMPNLGLNIQSRLYSFWDEVDENMLKAEIITQCKVFQSYVDDGSLDVKKTSYNKEPLLLIIVPVQIIDIEARLAIGIKVDDNGKTTYNYQFVEMER